MSQLNEVEDIMQEKLIEGFMEQGVYFQDPTSTYIDSEVTISSDKNISQHSFNCKTSIDVDCVSLNAQINDSVLEKFNSNKFCNRSINNPRKWKHRLFAHMTRF